MVSSESRVCLEENTLHVACQLCWQTVGHGLGNPKHHEVVTLRMSEKMLQLKLIGLPLMLKLIVSPLPKSHDLAEPVWSWAICSVSDE